MMLLKDNQEDAQVARHHLLRYMDWKFPEFREE